MDAEVHEAYVGQLLAGLEFFRTTLELQQEYVEPGQGVLNTLQRPPLISAMDACRHAAK